MVRGLSILLCTLWAGYGCAGTQAPERVAAPRAQPAPAAEPEREREPFALPEAQPLSIVLTAGHPERDVFTLLRRLEPGNPAVDLMQYGWRGMLAMRVGDALAEALDATRPWVVAAGQAAAEGTPVVGALPLRPGARDALLASYRLEPVGRGMLRLQARTHLLDSPLGHTLFCALLPRKPRDFLTCSERESWLYAHAEFTVEQAQTADSDAALRLEVHGKLVDAPAQALMPELQSEAGRAGYLSALELFGSMRDLSAAVTLEEGGYALTAGFDLRPVGDSLSALLVAPPPPGQPLPPEFRALPADASLAISSRGVHPDAAARVADRFWSMLQTVVSESQPDPRWDELFSHARKVFMRGGPFVLAYGHDPARALERLSKPAPETRRSALAGYWVFGFEGGYAELTRAAQALVELDRRGRAGPGAKGGSGPRLSLAKLRRRDRLPADARALTLVRPKSDTRPFESIRHILLAQADGFSYIVSSEDRELALARMRGVLSGKQSAPVERLLLLDRPGVEDAVLFGFVTQAALVSLGLPRDGSEASLVEAGAELQELLSLPDAGMTPISLMYQHEPASEGYRHAKLTVRLPHSVLQSLLPTEP